MRGVYFDPSAWDSYTDIQAEKALVKDIQRNGYKCSYGKPEMLRGDLRGYASVKIDKKNRLVFRVDDLQIAIIECGGHYGDR